MLQCIRSWSHFAVCLLLAFGGLTAAATAGQAISVLDEVEQLLIDEPEYRETALQRLAARNKDDIVPALIQIKRFYRASRAFDQLLSDLTGVEGARTWHEWMLWLEANPQVRPFDDFDVFKANLYQRIDPRFGIFLYKDVEHRIRLEEIVWGGVRKDGIPALTNPKRIAAAEAGYLTDGELVFGVSINGDTRAYPLRMMDWHEMFNDVIGGVPVSLAYCTLCGSGILFETAVEGRAEAFVFGSSGFLYRSNKLMYDQQTHSLWNQFTGRPVVGTLARSGLELKTRPVVISTWADWKARHPGTTVLAQDTGFERDYTPGKAYSAYFASPDLMFPARLDRDALKPKDLVFALRASPVEKAWSLKDFTGGKVINDTAGILDLVLIGDAATRTVRAYRADGRDFSKGADAELLVDATGKAWTVTEDALVGPAGEALTRLPGHVAYWFAWAGYFGKTGELARPGGTSR